MKWYTPVLLAGYAHRSVTQRLFALKTVLFSNCLNSLLLLMTVHTYTHTAHNAHDYREGKSTNLLIILKTF